MIQRIHVDNPHVWQEPPGAVGQVLLQLVVARREEGRQCRIVWEWIEGRGDEAEVQSARAYTDIQHLTTGNASPSELLNREEHQQRRGVPKSRERILAADLTLRTFTNKR